MITKFCIEPPGEVFPKSSSWASDCDDVVCDSAAIILLAFFSIGFAATFSLVSSLLFKSLISLIARSSKPRPMSFPTKADIPFSICKGGRSIHVIFEVCKDLRHANAIRAHSAVDLWAEETVEVEEEDLGRRVTASGKLVTLFNDRGCKGI